jgi:hypothetical protein
MLCLITNKVQSFKYSPPSEANRRSASQEIPTFYGTKYSIFKFAFKRRRQLSLPKPDESAKIFHHGTTAMEKH